MTLDAQPLYKARNFNDIKERQIDWLWRDQFATKVNIVAGAPGVGKSQIAAAFISVVTTGGRWPDNTPCKSGSAIIITSEDDAADTIKPRLMVAEASVDKVSILDAVIDNTGNTVAWTLDDIDILRGLIDEQGDTRLVVIDPITAYLGRRADSHNASDIRGLLAPLQELADKHHICLLLITHLNKSKGVGAADRITGSGAWSAVGRSTWLVGKDPTDELLRVLVPVKNNNGNDVYGFSYKIEGAMTNTRVDTSRVVWQGTTDVKADEVIAGPKKTPTDKGDKSARAVAARFLLDILQHGRQRSTHVYKAAEDAGIAESTLKRAKESLDILSKPSDGHWFMSLPELEESPSKKVK